MMTAVQQLLCHSLLLRRFARDEICAHFCAYLTDFNKILLHFFFILQLKFTKQMMLSHFQIIKQVVLTLPDVCPGEMCRTMCNCVMLLVCKCC